MPMLTALIETIVIEAAITFLIMWLKGYHDVHKYRQSHNLIPDGSRVDSKTECRMQKQTAAEQKYGNLWPRARRMVYYNLLCNMLTNPLLNLGLFGAAWLGASHGLINVLIAVGEICVVTSEYGLYRLMSRESRRLCLAVSMITNIASFLTGLLIN